MMHIIPEDDKPVLWVESHHEEDDHESDLLDIARDEQLDRHTSLFEQELCDTYQCSDYFAQLLSNSHPSGENITGARQQPDPSWRVNICEWLNQVMDIKGEVLYITMNTLDRYMSIILKKNAAISWNGFQLAALAAASIALKMTDSCMEHIPFLVEYTNDTNITANQISSKEQEVLIKLDWKIAPPTPHYFCKEYFQFLPEAVSGRKQDIIDRTIFLLYLSMKDFAFFVSMKANSIALAAVLNATRISFAREAVIFGGRICEDLMEEIRTYLGEFFDADEVASCQRRLYSLYAPEHDGNLEHIPLPVEIATIPE